MKEAPSQAMKLSDGEGRTSSGTSSVEALVVGIFLLSSVHEHSNVDCPNLSHQTWNVEQITADSLLRTKP